ncbi:Mu-like prophage major head subunit gpT family protein [Bradyrhizobium sp. PUT101]|uniref:Mu-like prophage major head subunit gpT family protein n=1 Tax=Bradyrhizobium sp. PUT101 TaxID=3447427 RepID=UPI003F86676B
MGVEKLITSRTVIGEMYMRLAAGAASFVDRYAMRMDSSQEIETYAWLGMAPKMREWIGGRQPKGLREQSFQITNKDFEATLEILTKDLRREKWGQIKVRIAELSRRTLTHPASLLTTLMINGKSAACYDGQYFYDTDHAEGDSGAQDNDLTFAAATATTPTVAEMRDAILKAIQAILGFRDDQGEPMNEDAREFDVVVPVALWAVAVSAVTLPTLDQGAANILTNMSDFKINVVPNARLSDATEFYVNRTDAETKPFILQEEVPLNVAAIAEGSELEFKEKKHWYGVDWAGNVGYGFWQHSVLTTFT